MTVNDALIESWKLSLHGKSPGTAKVYGEEIARFERWLHKNDRPLDAAGDLLAVTRQDAEAYFGSLRARGLAAATIEARWIAIRNLFRWCVEEDELDESPLAKVKVAHANPPPVRVVEPDDYQRLLKECTGRAFNDRRDAAMISLLYATGLRVSELCGLGLEQLDLTGRVLLIVGKGDRRRLVRFDASTAVLLDRYRRARGRHRHAGRPELWLGKAGRFTPTGVQQMLRRRALDAGIGHVHPHQFRHSFADRWLESGGQEGDLQRLGGWQNPDVMKRYGAARATDRALKAYDRIMGD